MPLKENRQIKINRWLGFCIYSLIGNIAKLYMKYKVEIYGMHWSPKPININTEYSNHELTVHTVETILYAHTITFNYLLSYYITRQFVNLMYMN